LRLSNLNFVSELRKKIEIHPQDTLPLNPIVLQSLTKEKLKNVEKEPEISQLAGSISKSEWEIAFHGKMN